MKKAIFFFASAFLFLSRSFSAQAAVTIVCDSILQTNLCPGATVVVPYTVTSGSLPLLSPMKVQLSNGFGLFTAPVDIGTSAVNVGIITSTIPAGTTFGFLYRVRVISTSTHDTSSQSPNTIIIAAPPVPTITSSPSNIACHGDTVTLSAGFALSYHWSNGDTTATTKITSTGDYSCTVTVGLCSATSTLYHVTFHGPAVPVISDYGTTLTSSTAMFYQWNDAFGPITGDTSMNFNPSANGTYTVTVHDTSGCFATSAPISIVLGITETMNSEILGIYPNPSFENATLVCQSSAGGNATVSITDVLGHKLSEKTILLQHGENRIPLDLQNISSGIYFISISTSSDRKIKPFVIK